MYDGVCYSFKLFGSRCAHYPECGDEWKPVKKPKQRAMALKYKHSSPWWHILSNLSLLAAASMVSEQAVRAKSFVAVSVSGKSTPEAFDIHS